MLWQTLDSRAGQEEAHLHLWSCQEEHLEHTHTHKLKTLPGDMRNEMPIKHAWCELRHQVPAGHHSGCGVQRVLHFKGSYWQRQSELKATGSLCLYMIILGITDEENWVLFSTERLLSSESVRLSSRPVCQQMLLFHSDYMYLMLHFLHPIRALKREKFLVLLCKQEHL